MAWRDNTHTISCCALFISRFVLHFWWGSLIRNSSLSFLYTVLRKSKSFFCEYMSQNLKRLPGDFSILHFLYLKYFWKTFLNKLFLVNSLNNFNGFVRCVIFKFHRRSALWHGLKPQKFSTQFPMDWCPLKQIARGVPSTQDKTIKVRHLLNLFLQQCYWNQTNTSFEKKKCYKQHKNFSWFFLSLIFLLLFSLYGIHTFITIEKDQAVGCINFVQQTVPLW